MRQNLGKLDRLLRFALAFWWLGPWAPRFTVANGTWLVVANWLLIIIGVIALIESFTGWCGIHSLLKINNKSQ